MQNIKALILDMDGVLWRANQPIGNLTDIFSEITNKGLKYTFATNNSGKTVSTYQNKISGFGIDVTTEQIISSATTTADFLRGEYPDGGPIYIIGEAGLFETLEKHNFRHTDKSPMAVVTGIDKNVNYSQLATAALLVRSGVRFIGTNPDPSFPTPQGLLPGAGAIQAAIQAASEIAPTVIGKPKPAMFKLAMKRMGVQPDETLMVGDRISTDIMGGQAAGCKTALVLSGVTTIEEAQAFTPPPDLIEPNLQSVVTKL